MPDINKSFVVFKDKMGQELLFNIIDAGDTIKHGRFAGSCETNPGQRVYLNYQKKNRTVRFENDSLHSPIFIWIDTELDFGAYNEYDVIKVSIPMADSENYQYVKIMTDSRRVSDDQVAKINSLLIHDSEIEILGKTFTDTYHLKNHNPNNSHLIYYNFEIGLVSFTDQSGKTWVFDRYE